MTYGQPISVSFADIRKNAVRTGFSKKMHYLMVASIVAVLSFDFLVEDAGLLPRLFRFAPELFALLACVLVVVAGVRNRFQYVRPQYWLLFGAISIVVVCGVIVNSLPPGPIFAGIRTYLRAMPFFFLPAVLAPSENQLRSQIRLVGIFCVLQLPVAIYQRLASIGAGLGTGDLTYGTLMRSSPLTLFLVPCAAVISALYIRKQITLRRFLIFLAIALVPTTMNASKAALFLAPLAIMTVFIVGAKRGTRFKNLIVSVLATFLFASAFFFAYDYYQNTYSDSDETLLEFFTTKGRLESYLDRGSEVGDAEQSAGKLGSIRNAIGLISKDPVTLVFGVGMGNVSKSSLGDDFSGQYFNSYGTLIDGTFALLMAEIGLLGLFLVILVYAAIFRDTLYVAKWDAGLMGTLALGWTGAVATLFVGMGQSSTMDNPALSVLFWYFSGLVVAHRARLEYGVVARMSPRPADGGPGVPRHAIAKPS